MRASTNSNSKVQESNWDLAITWVRTISQMYYSDIVAQERLGYMISYMKARVYDIINDI